MRYGNLFKTIKISDSLIKETIDNINFNLIEEDTAKAQMYNNISERKKSKSGTATIRSNKVTFIHNEKILSQYLKLSREINEVADWDFDIDGIEPLQYGEYHKSQEYGWHIDQHNKAYVNKQVRKISFSVFLNDNYTGGEFDLELYNPNNDCRYDTFSKLPLNTAIFFKSDYWHRVRPVTNGIRKSIVGWVLGPKMK
jgi:PKHD-type hydroxylase|tara:strand:+ start:76 stop:666 length:591 start_codon:yes stop_codon:yes gene_type:complete